MDIDSVQRAFGLSSLVLIVALVAVRLSRRLGLPSLLLYLGIGLLLGNRGVGLDFSNTVLTEQLGLAALVFILAEGGLTTRWTDVRPALGLGISLATVSVLVSIRWPAPECTCCWDRPWAWIGGPRCCGARCCPVPMPPPSSRCSAASGSNPGSAPPWNWNPA